MLRGCKIWAYTMMSLAFLSLLFYTSLLVRSRLERTGILLLNLLDTILACLQWLAVGVTACGLLLMMALVVRTFTHRQTVNIGPYGTLTRWGFGQSVTEHAPFTPPQLQRKEESRIEAPRPSNEREVHLLPAYVAPGRKEPDAEDFDSHISYGSEREVGEGFHNMEISSGSLSVADDMLEVAYIAICGGVLGRRALSRRLNCSPHMAISLIERLKGQGRLDDKGRPVNAS